jgi:hypothetical protein
MGGDAIGGGAPHGRVVAREYGGSRATPRQEPA